MIDNVPGWSGQLQEMSDCAGESVATTGNERVGVHHREMRPDEPLVGRATSSAEQLVEQQRFHMLSDSVRQHFNQPQHQNNQVNNNKQQQTISVSQHHQHNHQFQHFHEHNQQQQQQHMQPRGHNDRQQQQYTLLGGNQTGNNHQASSLDCSTFEEDLSPYWSDSTLSNGDNQAAHNQADKSKTGGGKSKGARNPLAKQRPRGRTLSKSERGNTNDNGSQEETSAARHESEVTNTSTSTSTNGGTGVKRKRHMANERERERTKSLNEALEILRNKLPVTEAEKRSKIQTLRTAKEYIEFLARLKATAREESAECDSSSQEITQYPHRSQFDFNINPAINNHHNHHQHHHHALNQANNNIDPTNQLPDSPLNIKFYKFRHSQKLDR